RLDASTGARIFEAPGSALVYAANPSAERLTAFAERGIDVARVPGAHDKVDLAAMLADLAVRGINELHVEAGHKLNGSFVRERLVDEYLIYLAPKLLGAGRDLAAFGPLTELADAVSLRFHQIDRVGEDLRVLARPRSGRDGG
ncbi:MAG: RibD family protein, partial [Burkholderiaceae bacterium]|nr:RibD family protein [Burkholderiaceae bacterium]